MSQQAMGLRLIILEENSILQGFAGKLHPFADGRSLSRGRMTTWSRGDRISIGEEATSLKCPSIPHELNSPA